MEGYRGRGALDNPEGRFMQQRTEPVDDGWHADAPPDAIPTEQFPEHARTILTRNESPDIPFDQSINPYRGCEHGCIYCYARPTHAYLNLSAGLDFETRLFYKVNAAALLETELSRRGYRPRVINLGSSTDPYQPIEREHRITRALLEVLLRFRHPVTIVTKSHLVLRDLDLLQELATRNLCHVSVSVTTLDEELKRRLEPRAPSPAARLKAIAGLAAAKVPVGVMAAPMIPALNDHELERIFEAAAQAGAGSAHYILLRLPFDVKELFEAWLREHVPLRAEHVLSRVRAMRGGALNDARFGSRFQGEGVEAKLLQTRCEAARRRYGLERREFTLDTGAFRVPAAATSQLTLEGFGDSA
jgi:DNA repair photolyase